MPAHATLNAMRLVTAPDDRLRVVCTDVPLTGPQAWSHEQRARAANAMLDAMYGHEGIGLAAPQLGLDVRIVVIEITGDPKRRDVAYVMFNPVITKASTQTSHAIEGCLSLPGVAGAVERPRSVAGAYVDLEGTRQTFLADGLLARCYQHELEHLDGILFTDHLVDTGS